MLDQAPSSALVSTRTDLILQGIWVGHSTVLLRIGELNVLTDPVFSSRCGIYFGLGNLGPKRLAPPAISLKNLPKIDLILLSHAHMDHFDVRSLRALESQGTQVVTARKTSDLLRIQRYKNVTELGWGESTQAGPLRVTAFEVRHWGARMMTDNWRGYNGYTIEGEGTRVLFGGDTAFTNTFRSLRSSKPFDLAIMPIGAYDPWIAAHCNPEQAWQMGTDASAHAWLPVHHKTFALSREPQDEPIERFLTAAGRDSGRVMTCDIGDSFEIY